MRQVQVPHYKGLIVRKTYPELEELIDKSLSYYPRAFPGAKYNASAHAWRFPALMDVKRPQGFFNIRLQRLNVSPKWVGLNPSPTNPSRQRLRGAPRNRRTPRVKKSLGLFYMRYSHSIVPTGFGVRS